MNNDIFKRIDELMRQQKKRQRELNQYLGLTHSTYDNWKRGTSESFMKYIEKIAEYLNVSPNYLICGKDDVSLPINKRKEDEDRIIHMIRSLPEKELTRLLRIIEAFSSTVEPA